MLVCVQAFGHHASVECGVEVVNYVAASETLDALRQVPFQSKPEIPLVDARSHCVNNLLASTVGGIEVLVIPEKFILVDNLLGIHGVGEPTG